MPLPLCCSMPEHGDSSLVSKLRPQIHIHNPLPAPFACSPYLVLTEPDMTEHLTDVLLLQMRMHIAEGALRVKVLNKAAGGKEFTALDTAWHYDLVITTFQRLSVEWSNGRIKAKSIFSQVMHLCGTCSWHPAATDLYSPTL